MMPVSNWQVYGMTDAIKASKYPKSVNIGALNSEITLTTDKLAKCATGTGHDQFLTGIVVQFDLTFSIKAWVEAERYHFLDFVSSQSTMHRVEQMDISAQCNDYVLPETVRLVERLKAAYEVDPTPDNRLKILYNLPAGLTYTARMTTNYRQLKTIYQQRRNHRLPEWREFCRWCEMLPMSCWITGKGAE